MNSQHSKYLKHKDKVRYRSEFDYYSLDMVLLEIGHWKPLNKITVMTDDSSEDYLNHLRKEKISGLEFAIGTIYRDVVDACLNEDFDKPENVDGDSNSFISVALNFAKIVVKHLAKC